MQLEVADTGVEINVQLVRQTSKIALRPWCGVEHVQQSAYLACRIFTRNSMSA